MTFIITDITHPEELIEFLYSQDIQRTGSSSSKKAITQFYSWQVKEIIVAKYISGYEKYKYRFSYDVIGMKGTTNFPEYKASDVKRVIMKLKLCEE